MPNPKLETYKHKATGVIYDLTDKNAQAAISDIQGVIPNGTTTSNELVNESTINNLLEDKADAADLASVAESVSDIEDKIPNNASSSNQLATKSDVSSAYRPGGNATLATLPALTEANLGKVFNIIEDFTTTADFAEGAGIAVKAGNEVGIIDISTTNTPNYKYSVLGGFVDLSGYVKKSATTGLLKNDGSVDTKTYATQASVNGKVDGTHIFYKNDNATDKYYKIYECSESASSYVQPISIIGTCGFYGNSYKKTFNIIFDPRSFGVGTIPCRGVVSNSDELGQYTTNADIIATLDGNTVRIYANCKSVYSYVDAYVNTSIGSVFTDSSADNAMLGTEKSKLSDIVPVTSKQDILTFDNTPTNDSNNPVKSGGIYTAIQIVAQAIVNEAQTARGTEGSLAERLTSVEEEVGKLNPFSASETILDSSGGEILDSSNNRILDSQVGTAGVAVALSNVLSWFKTNASHLVQDSGYTINKATYELINS